MPAVVFLTALRPVRDPRVRGPGARLPGQAGERGALRRDDQAAHAAACAPRRSRDRRSSSRRARRRGAVRSREIDWIEAADNYARIWIGGRSYLLRDRSRARARRRAHGFARAHRQALVRLAAVRALEDATASSSRCSSPARPSAFRGADEPRLPPHCAPSRDSRARNTRREAAHPNANTTRVRTVAPQTEAMHRSRGLAAGRRIVLRRALSFCCVSFVIVSSPVAAQPPASRDARATGSRVHGASRATSTTCSATGSSLPSARRMANSAGSGAP